MARQKKTDVDDILSSDTSADLDLYNDIAKGLNKQYGANDMLDDVEQYISFGSVQADTITSNDAEKGGAPVGFTTMVVGPSQSGKSLVGYHLLLDTQRQGGVAVLLDAEHRASKPFMKKIGINLDKLIYRQPETIEEAFQMAQYIIDSVVEKNSGKKPTKPITIVLDSLVAAKTEDEKDMEYGDKKYASQAGIISTSLRKIASTIKHANVAFIIVNQLRKNLQMKNPYDEKYIIPGGEAPIFWSHVIAWLTSSSKIEVDGMIIGYETNFLLRKNSLAGRGRKCKFDIYFNRGIDDVNANFELLKKKVDNLDGKFKVISTQQFEITLENGETITFKSKQWDEIYQTNKQYIDNMIRKLLVIDLSNPNLEITRTDVEDDFDVAPKEKLKSRKMVEDEA